MFEYVRSRLRLGKKAALERVRMATALHKLPKLKAALGSEVIVMPQPHVGADGDDIPAQVRAEVFVRDHGRCVVPGCTATTHHLRRHARIDSTPAPRGAA